MDSKSAMIHFLVLILGLCISSTINAASINYSEEQAASQEGLISSKAIPIPPSSYDAFISYRQAPSKHLAMLVKVMLKQRGIEAFIDVDGLRGGNYHDQLMGTIRNTSNFIIVLSKTSLDKCKGDTNFTDILHQEMREADTLGKRIVPVFDDYDFPNPADYSTVIQNVVSNQGVVWVHHLVVGSIERLIQYLDLPAKPTATTAVRALQLEATFRKLGSHHEPTWITERQRA